MNSTEEYALVICDISGYTRFVTSQEVRNHGFVVVGQLLKAVLSSVAPALLLAKVEGDAVFLYRPLPADPARQAAVLREVVVACDRAFHHFAERRRELVEANICGCGACRSAGELELKAILSCGEVLEQRIGKHRELVGLEVIRLHRLLKNSVEATSYLLVTENTAARLADLALPDPTLVLEEHGDLGDCPARVYSPPLGLAAVPTPRSYKTVGFKARDILTKIFVGRLFQVRLVPPRPPRPDV